MYFRTTICSILTVYWARLHFFSGVRTEHISSSKSQSISSVRTSLRWAALLDTCSSSNKDSFIFTQPIATAVDLNRHSVINATHMYNPRNSCNKQTNTSFIIWRSVPTSTDVLVCICIWKQYIFLPKLTQQSSEGEKRTREAKRSENSGWAFLYLNQIQSKTVMCVFTSSCRSESAAARFQISLVKVSRASWGAINQHWQGAHFARFCLFHSTPSQHNSHNCKCNIAQCWHRQSVPMSLGVPVNSAMFTGGAGFQKVWPRQRWFFVLGWIQPGPYCCLKMSFTFQLEC